MSKTGGWKCRDCKKTVAEIEEATGWVSIMAIGIKPYDGTPTAVKPWYALCDLCKMAYSIPDDLEKKAPPGSQIEGLEE